MTTQPATITVAIPTYNRRHLLERAVDSVLAETRVPIRLCVSDNASTDGTDEFMAALVSRDQRVSYRRHKTNLGGLRNIHGGLSEVETEYFVPLADDDHLLPDFLHDAFHIMESMPEVGAAVFGTEARRLDDTLVEIFPSYLSQAPGGRIEPVNHLCLWLRHGHCAWSSILWRREVMAQVGVPYAGTGLAGDVDFQARAFAAFPAFLVDRPGAVFRMHDAQACQGFDITHLPEWAEIFTFLDRAAEALDIPRATYREARQAAWERLRWLWNRPNDAVPPAARERLALLAGFALGDWPLAYTLAGASGPSRPGREWSVPGLAVSGRPRDLMLGVVRRFADMEGAINHLRAELQGREERR